MAPDTKTKSISIQTPSQVIFDPPTKPGRFRPLHWNQVNSDPPPGNQVYFDHPYNNQINFDTNNKIKSFPSRVILRVMHTGTCSCDAVAIRHTYEYHHDLLILDVWAFYAESPKIWRKCITIFYTSVFYFIHGTLYIHDYLVRATPAAGLRYVPFLPYVVFLGVIYRS